MTARHAEAGDLAALRHLGRLAAGELASQRGGPLLLLDLGVDQKRDVEALWASFHDEARNDPEHQLLVVGTFDDVVVGAAFARLDELGDETVIVNLRVLYVEPEARAVGIGEVMMDRVIAWGVAHQARGIESVALPGNRDWKNFFERYGLVARALIVHRSLVSGDALAVPEGAE